MRCFTAVTYALYTNNNYKDISWVKDSVIESAKKSLNEKIPDFEPLFLIPNDNLKVIIEPFIARLIKEQKPSGGWKIKDTHRITCNYLRLFKKAGKLDEMLKQFKHNPLNLFQNQNDIISYIVRSDIFGLDNSETKRQLYQKVVEEQKDNGSWENSVIATEHFLALLLNLKFSSQDIAVKKGINFILSCYQKNVNRESKNHGNILVASSMFSNTDRHIEFEAALKYNPDWNPVQLCYMHLPMIQTGRAIKCLNILGYENHEKVIAGCDNFVTVYQKYGGFCDGNIRDYLIRAEKMVRMVR